MLNLLPKDLARFWNKVDKTTDCWNWTAAKSSKGYGRFKLNGKLVSPHVLSYQMHNNDHDSTKDVCHICDNPSCVNPDHLFLGSRSDNMRDCRDKGRLVLPDNTGKKFRAKVTEEQVKEIRASIASSKDLSELYNLSVRSINDIKSYTTWADV